MLKKKSKKAKKYHGHYQEVLSDLAEARNAANRVRSEMWKDDSSPFNPPLTEEDAYWVIKKSVEAIEQEEKQNKSKEDNKR